MEALFKITDIAFFLAVAFLTLAALITAIRCRTKPGNAAAAWILFVGCGIGAFASFGYLVVGLLPSSWLYDAGPDLARMLFALLAVINLVSTVFMVLGAAMFRPLAAREPQAGAQ